MIKTCFSTLLVILSMLFLGCTPEETSVTVKASELQKAANGQLGQASVEMVFSVQSDDASIPGKVKQIALPYLGKNGTIDILNPKDSKFASDYASPKMVGRFTIPVGTEAALMDAPSSLLALKYRPSDKTFLLVPGENVSALNRALSSIDSTISFEFTGGYASGFETKGTTIKILDDCKLHIGVVAVKVNDEDFLSGSISTARGPITISYNNSFYDKKAPCFILGSFPKMSTLPLGETPTFNF